MLGVIHRGSDLGDASAIRAGADAAGLRGGDGTSAQRGVADREAQENARKNHILVIAQMACVVLLTGAMPCVRGLKNASTMDPGFDTHHIALAAALDPGSMGYTSQKMNIFLCASPGARATHSPELRRPATQPFCPRGRARLLYDGKQLGKAALRQEGVLVDPLIGLFRARHSCG
jgi:hypothetical protein